MIYSRGKAVIRERQSRTFQDRVLAIEPAASLCWYAGEWLAGREGAIRSGGAVVIVPVILWPQYRGDQSALSYWVAEQLCKAVKSRGEVVPTLTGYGILYDRGEKWVEWDYSVSTKTGNLSSSIAPATATP